MNCNLRLVAGVMFAVYVAGPLLSKPLPAVPQTAVDELGVEQGVPRNSGFVFIEGRYIPPPYTMTRRGNGIFINRVQVDQPIPWSYFDSDSEIDPDLALANLDSGDKFISAAETVPLRQPVEADNRRTKQISKIDDLFDDTDDDRSDATQKAARQPKTITSIDDLFGDNDDDADSAQAVKKNKSQVDSLSDLFSDDAVVPAVKTQRTRVARRSASTAGTPVKLTAAQIAERKEILKKSLDEQRAFYERAIAKGELYFFGSTHHKINGTYGTARALIEVLPDALRYSLTPSELQSRLRDGGVYFVDINVCQALYRHKMTFPLLQQRLEKIQLEEAVQAANQKKY